MADPTQRADDKVSVKPEAHVRFCDTPRTGIQRVGRLSLPPSGHSIEESEAIRWHASRIGMPVYDRWDQDNQVERLMTAARKDQIRSLLKGIETGDPSAVAVVNPEKYIQHNPQTHEGSEGLAALFQRLSKTNPRVNIVRAFADGDYVFAHTEYDFASRKIGFEVFRYEDDLVVEHWDNIQPRQGPNPSGHSMVDGPTEASEPERTEQNRNLVRSFVNDVLIPGRLERLERFVDAAGFTQHNPQMADGLPALRAALEAKSEGNLKVRYDRLHRLLAEGSFVLAVSEGALDELHTAFYDLYRIAGGKIVEHWDTIEAIPPRSAWKNDNGKF